MWESCHSRRYFSHSKCRDAEECENIDNEKSTRYGMPLQIGGNW